MKDCNACGKCCTKYGGGQLSASSEDIELWESFRPDIAAYVKGGEIWFDPITQERTEQCPFLRKDSNSPRYLCDIYADRPEDCRAYPMTVADMIKDDCEMLEPHDLNDLERVADALSYKS